MTNFRNAGALALALAFVAIAIGCTKLGQEDPYADKADAIRNGLPPTNVGEKPRKPVASDALRIQAQDYYSFKEGEQGRFQVTGSVLEPVNGRAAKYGEDFVIEIVNLADFPGANWDAVSATLTWTPPQGFVDKEYSRNMRMLISLKTTALPILVREQEVKVFVIRAERDPEIVSVENLKNQWTREGEKRKFTVIVKDPDSLDADKMRPRLMVVSVNQGVRNASNLIYEFQPNVWNEKNPTQDPVDPTKWIFTMIADLQADTGEAREITKGLERFQFGLVAANRFGGSSAPMPVDIPIVTTLRDPVVSWIIKEPVELVSGQENTFSFSVYDPNAEAKVTVFPTRCDLLPGKPSCSCVPQDRDSTSQLCTVRWNPPATEIGRILELRADLLAESRVKNDPIAPRKSKFSGRVKVVQPPTPPQPNPSPAPGPSPIVPAAPNEPAAADAAGGQ
ncbi:MAG: hypothetical protein V4760_11795 [Bdellovibrionota bacterium]